MQRNKALYVCVYRYTREMRQLFTNFVRIVFFHVRRGLKGVCFSFFTVRLKTLWTSAFNRRREKQIYIPYCSRTDLVVDLIRYLRQVLKMILFLVLISLMLRIYIYTSIIKRSLIIFHDVSSTMLMFVISLDEKRFSFFCFPRKITRTSQGFTCRGWHTSSRVHRRKRTIKNSIEIIGTMYLR